MMNVCVIGCSPLGLATGITLAQLGHKVRFSDIDDLIIVSIGKGETPFHEPMLSSMLKNGLRKRKISVDREIGDAVRNSSLIFIATEITTMKSGAPNLKPLKKCAEEIGKALTENKIVVIKSPVPPGITAGEIIPILEENSGIKSVKNFGVAVNPGFVRRGSLVADSLEPTIIVVGSSAKRTAAEVLSLYDRIDAQKIITDLETAEMTKFYSDLSSAVSLSFMNEMANICEMLGIDTQRVMNIAKSTESRENDEILGLGLGFGGESLPNELSILISIAEAMDYKPELLKAVKKINDLQPLRAVQILEEELGSLEGKKIAILGLAFRAGIGDATETKAFLIAVELLARGAKVVGYDPLATASFIEKLPGISYASSARDALLSADGCIIQTAEEEFNKLGKEDFSEMKTKIVIDGRRILSPTKLSRYGIKVRAIGLGRKG